MSAFDPIQHVRDARSNPAAYCTLPSVVAAVETLRAIRAAKTMAGIDEAFQGPARAARKAGDTELLDWLKDAAKKRKAELEAK